MRPGEPYGAGLVLTALFLPTTAAIATVLAYLLLPDLPGKLVPDGVTAIAIGLFVTLVVWLVLGVLARPLASAQNAQPRFFRELRGRHRLISDRLSGSIHANVPDDARKEAAALLDDVRTELATDRTGPGLRWALGYGYTNQLRELHRAAELLILVESSDEVVGDALDDDLSLEDSTIAGRDRLRSVLRAAVGRLSVCTSTTFMPVAPGTSLAPNQCLSEMEAREAVAEVHHAVKAFRDDQRDGLLRVRNNIIWASLALEIPAFLLLGLALIEGVPRVQIVTAATFYLVGAAVALFQRLDSEAKRDTDVDDLGLYQARLLTAHVLSGLAAVAGVYLVTVAPGLTGADSTSRDALMSVFDLTKNQVGLVYAAVFGLSPALLTNRLDQQAGKLTQALSASEPAAATTH